MVISKYLKEKKTTKMFNKENINKTKNNEMVTALYQFKYNSFYLMELDKYRSQDRLTITIGEDYLKEKKRYVTYIMAYKDGYTHKYITSDLQAIKDYDYGVLKTKLEMLHDNINNIINANYFFYLHILQAIKEDNVKLLEDNENSYENIEEHAYYIDMSYYFKKTAYNYNALNNKDIFNCDNKVTLIEYIMLYRHDYIEEVVNYFDKSNLIIDHTKDLEEITMIIFDYLSLCKLYELKDIIHGLQAKKIQVEYKKDN